MRMNDLLNLGCGTDVFCNTRDCSGWMEHGEASDGEITRGDRVIGLTDA
jgi:hypothetical protein